MSLEELFEYLSTALSDYRHDRFPEQVLLNSRYPDSYSMQIRDHLSQLIDQLNGQTELIQRQAQAIRLMGVNPDDDSAYIEIVPLPDK